MLASPLLACSRHTTSFSGWTSTKAALDMLACPVAAVQQIVRLGDFSLQTLLDVRRRSNIHDR